MNDFRCIAKNANGDKLLSMSAVATTTVLFQSCRCVIVSMFFFRYHDNYRLNWFVSVTTPCLKTLDTWYIFK